MALLHFRSQVDHPFVPKRIDQFHIAGMERKLPTSKLFVDQEAMLNPEGRNLIAETDIKGDRLVVAIRGLGAPTARLDTWELAAARLASIGRQLRQEYPSLEIDLEGPITQSVGLEQEIIITQYLDK